jgi:hypothetical protein
MRKIVLAIFFLLCSAAAAAAQTQPVIGHNQPAASPGTPQFWIPWAPVKPLGYCQITSLSSATTLASGCSGGIPTVPGTSVPASMVLIQTETQAVRYRDDGTAPTSSVGFPLATGVTLTYIGTLSNLQFIQESSSATLDVLFYQ